MAGSASNEMPFLVVLCPFSQSLKVRRASVETHRSHHDSVHSGLNNEQVHHGLLEVPALPGGEQDEDGHGDDSSVAILAGKLLEWNKLG